jgi:hypothetical protein
MVPGHGPLGTTDTLRRWVEYFGWLVEQAATGMSAADIPPPEDMKGWWRFLAWKHADSAGKVVAAVRSGSLRPASDQR